MRITLISIFFTLLTIGQVYGQDPEDGFDGPPTDDPVVPIDQWVPLFMLLAIVIAFFVIRRKLITNNATNA